MGMSFSQMGANEWLIVAGAVLGPILAVQVQKLVEALSAGKIRREQVFTTLMATRQARLSPEHVGALNSIDLAFYDTGVWAIRWRPQSFQEVRSEWSIYRRHLSLPADAPAGPAAEALFQGRAEELFVNLLVKMAVCVGYKFNREELQTGSYSPRAHGELERQQLGVRKGMLDVLSGKQALSMNVTSFPADQELAERTVKAQEDLARAIHTLAQSGPLKDRYDN